MAIYCLSLLKWVVSDVPEINDLNQCWMLPDRGLIHTQLLTFVSRTFKRWASMKSWNSQGRRISVEQENNTVCCYWDSGLFNFVFITFIVLMLPFSHLFRPNFVNSRRPAIYEGRRMDDIMLEPRSLGYALRKWLSGFDMLFMKLWTWPLLMPLSHSHLKSSSYLEAIPGVKLEW